LTENSTVGLTMLDAERSVVVAGDEHLQDVLRDHPARITIELVPVGPRLEARLDGERVGELSALMSLRYAPTVDGVLRRGERPGCVGRIIRGKHGVDVELRLPAVNAAGGPPTEQLPVIVATRRRSRSRTPLWVGVGIVALLVVIGGVVGLTRVSAPPAAAVAAVPTRVAAAPSTVATVADRPTLAPSRKAAPSTTPKPPVVYYKNCGVALAEGAAPIERGEPGYRSGLDPDGDGVACPV
jgi:excalibur calcium-binding domain-containing protein